MVYKHHHTVNRETKEKIVLYGDIGEVNEVNNCVYYTCRRFRDDEGEKYKRVELRKYDLLTEEDTLYKICNTKEWTLYLYDNITLYNNILYFKDCEIVIPNYEYCDGYFKIHNQVCHVTNLERIMKSYRSMTYEQTYNFIFTN